MIFLLFLPILVLLYYYSRRNHDYWAKRNIKHERPIPLFGNHLSNHLGLKSFTQITTEIYKKYPEEKMVGYYRGTIPMLIIRDLDLVKQIMSIDFQYFFVREHERNNNLEPLYKSLGFTNDDNWRLLRRCWTPAFTVNRLRAMYPLILHCTERLQNMVTNLANSETSFDALELMSRFNIEVTGACGFGVDMDTINKERSHYLQVANKILSPNLRNQILLPLSEMFPEIKNFIRIDNDTVEREIRNILLQVRKQRNGKPIGRNDFVDLLLETEAKGKIVAEVMEKVNPDGSLGKAELEMDLDCQVAQIFVFFFAGFKTSSLSTSHTLHKLAYHPDIQERIQKEIDMALSEHNGRLCYDAVDKMPLLNMAFKESLRLLSPGHLRRVCTRKYKIPGTDITIDPGVTISIPVQAIQMDEKYYDNPTEFRPERFTPQAIKERHKYAYLPFGDGPRSCVGKRLAYLQSLSGLAAILHKFTVEPAKSSVQNFEIDPTYNVIQHVKGGFPLIYRPRNNSKTLFK